MSVRRSKRTGSIRRRGAIRIPPEVISALGAAAAILAPATLTGSPVIDALERGLVVGFVSYVGSYGRRWPWLIAAAITVIPAHGTSLILGIAALLVLAASAVPTRRSRATGALGLALMGNAIVWYPPSIQPWGVALGVVAMATVVISGFPHLRRPKRRVASGILVAAGVVVLVGGVAAVAAMGLAYRHVQTGSAAARDALDGARDGDAASARDDLADASSAFRTASARIDGPLTVPARLVPGLSQQVDAVRTTVDQGRQISDAADDLVATADYDKLQYDGRLDLDQVKALAAPARRADLALSDARDRLEDLQGATLLPPLADRIDQFAADIDEARADTALAADLLEVTPGLFGADGPRRYLIIFLTPAELRGSGGFIGSYAELEIDGGKATLTRSGRIDDLIDGPNKGNRTISGPKDYLRRYGRFDLGDYIQDVTISPDFPSSASVMAELYPQAGGEPVDGVIAVDPSGLAALLALTGPVTVDGLAQPLSADNAEEVLTKSQYLDLPDRAARGEILTEATRVTFERLIESSLPAPRKLADTLSPAVRAGHLRLWSPDPGEQALFERLGATGDLALPRGYDGFSVVQQNAGNNKLDAYLQRKITYLPKVDVETGELTAEMRIELTNAVPSVDLPPAVVDNARGVPIGTNLASLTIYTHSVAVEANIDGLPITLGPGTEQGLNAWDTPQIRIGPGKTVVLTVQFEGGVDLSKGYRLAILPQPVANPDRFTSTLSVVGGNVKATGSTDEVLLDDEPLEAPTRIRVPLSD